MVDPLRREPQRLRSLPLHEVHKTPAPIAYQEFAKLDLAKAKARQAEVALGRTAHTVTVKHETDFQPAMEQMS